MEFEALEFIKQVISLRIDMMRKKLENDWNKDLE